MGLAGRRSIRLSPLFVAAFSLAVTIAQAAPNEWASIGPDSEPIIHSLVVHPRLASTIYAGGIGTIWRTEDRGRNWTGVETPLDPGCEIRALVMDPTEPSRLYAGCAGVIKSIDSGRTWTSIVAGMEDRGAIPAVWAIAIDPSAPQTLYAGTPLGTVFKSLDGGAHWQPTGALPDAAREIRALAIDPASPNTVYAGATVGGVFKTLDGGNNWTIENRGLPTNQVTSLAIDSRSPTTLYAGTIGRGVFKTTDGAASWSEVFGPDDVGGLNFTVAELAIDPFSPSTLYAAMGDENLGVFQTTDAGATWRQIKTGLPFYAALRALAIAPSSPSTIYTGLFEVFPGLIDGGVFEVTVTTRCPSGPTTAGIVEFAVPTPNSEPLGIAQGPDCALWFTERVGNMIGRITPTGEITEFMIPTPLSNTARIVTGPDGALWFTETSGNKIGRITTAGAFTEFALPTARSFPIGIAVGADGNLWFTEQGGGRIGRITPAGTITEFLIPPLQTFVPTPLGIVAGGDGNLWFSESFTGRVGRITTEGVITLFRVEPVCCASLGEITAGPDGNFWFPEEWDNKIVRITPAGIMEHFKLPSPGFEQGSLLTAYGIAAGADGALWYTQRPGTIGRLTTLGVISEFQVPTAGAAPVIITAGPDGHMWFTELAGNKIGRITVGPPAPPPSRRRVVRH